MAWKVILKNGEQHSFDHKPADEEIDALYAGQGDLPSNTEVAGSEGNTGQMEVSGVNLRKSGSSISYKPKKMTTLDLDTKKKIRDELIAYNTGKAFLNRVKDEWLKTNPAKSDPKTWGAMTPVMYGAEQWIGQSNLNPLSQITKNQRMDRTYIRWINATRSKLAREVIGKDVGNLNEYEQKVATGGVPGIMDTYETGQELLEKTERVLKDMRDARLQGYGSLDAKLKSKGKILNESQAKSYLEKAKGDAKRARFLAAADGWAF